ncbi:hypothetical protein [Streptomyces rochei]|uniref:hypothetical protein n=1 Tax=Streptomyces rochei TaxID=1928 RepID=UPI003697A287
MHTDNQKLNKTFSEKALVNWVQPRFKGVVSGAVLAHAPISGGDGHAVSPIEQILQKQYGAMGNRLGT